MPSDCWAHFLSQILHFAVVQSLSCVPILCNPMDCSRLPCPSPPLGACSDSCPLSQRCHPTISSSVVPFSSHLQSFPASGYFQMSQFFVSGGQSIGVSASVSALPKNIQDWFPLEWTGWISLLSKGLSRVFSSTTVQKHQLKLKKKKVSILRCSAFFMVQLSHPHMTTGKTIVLTRWRFVGKVMSLLFNMPSRLVIVFLLRSKRLVFHGCGYHLQWFWSPQN